MELKMSSNSAVAGKIALGLVGVCVYSVLLLSIAHQKEHLRPKRSAKNQGYLEARSYLTCPAGFTGQYCENALCFHKGYVPGGLPSLVPIQNSDLASCTGSTPIAVDSYLTSIQISISAPVPTGTPLGLILTNPNGVAVSRPNVITNSSRQVTIGLDSPMSGVWQAQYFSKFSGPCTLAVNGFSGASMSYGFITNLHSDNVTALAHHSQTFYVAFEALAFSCGGQLTYVEVWFNGQKLTEGSLSTRYNCAYQSYFGPIVSPSMGTFLFKVYGVDQSGFTFQRDFFAPSV